MDEGRDLSTKKHSRQNKMAIGPQEAFLETQKDKDEKKSEARNVYNYMMRSSR